MKRDLNLCRMILLEMERRASWEELSEPFEFEGYNWQQVSDHIKLLHEAGYIDAIIKRGGSDGTMFSECLPVSLKWAGHEFLDAAREEPRWRQFLKRYGDKLALLSFEVIKQLLLREGAVLQS